MKKRGDLQAADEPALIDAAVQGDIEAFGYLHERYRSDLYAICLRRLKDPSLAEDAVQDVFIRGFTSFPNFDSKKPFWPWLVAIAFRACIDIQRRRSLTHYSGDIDVSVEAGANGHAESALDEVIASEERAEFWRSLDILPERQRRVFLSFTLDGMSCADIASAEGISLGAVHMLLFRARRKMQSVRQSRPLPAIVLPFNWLRWRFQRMEERIRPLLGAQGEGFSSACAQVVCLGTLVTMVVAASNFAKPFNGNEAGRFSETSLSSTVLSAAQSRTQLTDSNIVPPAKVSIEPQHPVVETAAFLPDDAINLNQSATPEATVFNSLMTSPNYESDHTILAAGYCWSCGSNVLFVSKDGGASWKPLPSRLFLGRIVVISPEYPQDRRVFALGDYGLQQSDDGGGIFRTVNPLVGWGLAIPPSFGRRDSRLSGDSKILIGGKTLLEYDAGAGVVQPASLPIPPSVGGVYSSITYSPGYQSDSTLFVSSNSGQILYHCKGSVCNERWLPTPGPLMLRLSPRFENDGLAYAFADSELLASNDGARTFQGPLFSSPADGSIADVAILWNKSSDPVIFVSVRSFTSGVPGVYRSFDSGHSWERKWVEISSFGYGPEKLVVTPTGRLLATGASGIACSEDHGQTWAPRCPPEK